MYSLKDENFFIEIDDDLLWFLRKDQEIHLIKHKENEVIEDKIILDRCSFLINVILNTENKISIIVMSEEKELVLYTIFSDKVIDKVILLRAMINTKYIEVVSVNNSLNLFYISENNNMSTLFFRVLNSSLILSPPLALENININSERPFIVSVDNSKMKICYVKAGYPSLIGYRNFDFKKNSWSVFNLLDSSYPTIQDYSFTTFKDIISYSFTCRNQEKALIKVGFGAENIKRYIIEEAADLIDVNNIALTSNGDLYIIYFIGDTIKLKKCEGKESIKSIEEINFSYVYEKKKYAFQTNKNIYTNFIIKVIYGEEIFFTNNFFYNRYFYNKYLSKIQQETTKINSVENKNLTIVERDNYDKSIKDNNTNTTQEVALEELNIKLKTYEERLKIITKNNRKYDDERNKLRHNMTSLHEELNKKCNRINTLEKALVEKQSLIQSYENRLKELTESMKELKSKGSELEHKQEEIGRLKQLITDSDSEKISYINETKKLRSEINNLNLLIYDKTEEVMQLKNQLAVYQEGSKESFLRKLFKNGE